MEKKNGNGVIGNLGPNTVIAPFSDDEKARSVAIKEMCRKFEKLSGSNSSRISESRSTAAQHSKNAAKKSIDDIQKNGMKYNHPIKSDNNSLSTKEKNGTLHKNIINSREIISSNDKNRANTVNCDNSTQVPIAPVRRNKCRPHLSSREFEDILPKQSVYGRSCKKDICENEKRISVRERTKLFETYSVADVPLKFSNNISHNLSIHNKPPLNLKRNYLCSEKNEVARNPTDLCDSTKIIPKSSICDRFVTENSETPPNKPPRSFVHSELHDHSINNIADRFSQINVRGKLPQMQSRHNKSISLIDSIPLDSLKKTAVTSLSAGCEYDPIREKKITKLVSAPLKIINDEKGVKKSPKAQAAIINKTYSIVNYFKHLSSTANNFRDKAKQKQGVFVDLTPTTVSPPKNYGTLKKSFSDEHIYAEPIFSMSVPEKTKMSERLVFPINCMGTPTNSAKRNKLLCTKNCSVTSGNESSSPGREKKIGISFVRNMIYQSFSALRNSEISKDGDTLDDTESDVSAKDIQERIIYVRSVKRQVSACSICISPKLFETAMIIGILENKPVVLFQFPHEPKQGFDYPLLPHICFPDMHLLKPTATYKSETFHFTLVDGEEEKMFGYCHRTLGWPGGSQKLSFTVPCAICILSTLSAPLFYKKLLNEIQKHLVLSVEQCTGYITSLQRLGMPNAGANLSITDSTELDGTSRVVIARPLDFHAVNINFTRVLQLLDVDVLLKAVASLLLERRVLLLSNYSSNLFQCSEAISSLLYPFHWQHLVIPVLPKCLLVQACTDSPYLLGVVSADENQVLDLLSEHQILIIDIDNGTVIKSYEDEDSILPKKIQKAVIAALNLAKNMTDPTEMLRDVMISEAFVRMFVEIFGHYEEFFIMQNGSLVMQKEAFQKKPSSRGIQSFLQWFSETQMFDTFVEECIWRKNYRNISQSQHLTYFEKRVAEYKWELACDNEKLSKIIGKTVKNFSEKLKMLKSF